LSITFFEEQRRAVAFQDPVGDLGDLQFSFDGDR
jgi:hypothetical protein